MKLHKGDTVVIISGKDRGKKGKIIKALPEQGKIVVEGAALRKKHVKPRRSGEKGQMVVIPGAFWAANAQLVCPKCGKAARVGYVQKSKSKEQKSKIRICKKCRQVI